MRERGATGPVSGILLIGLVSLAGAWTGVPATAQEQRAEGSAPPRCDLRQAQADYRQGRFDALLTALPDCIRRGFSGAEVEEALALLAKTHLALDNLDEADATLDRLLTLNPLYQPGASDPPRFIERVNASRDGSGDVVVRSVSKTAESLREAPATVVVVTAEEIARRGYLDLEQVLHDLPGFDISRARGDFYSLFYQRGYRGQNDRTLLLVDGVEENDLWSNGAYLSRQYPLSNVERIEVVYGPASTLYGPNAFTGVINILTKEPGQDLDGRSWSVNGMVAGGSFNTRLSEATLEGRLASKGLAYSVTARVYTSDQPDRSGFDDWDFDPAFFDGVDYASALATNGNLLSATDRERLRGSPLFVEGADGVFRPTAEAQALARGFDRAAMTQLVGGAPLGYTNEVQDWLIHGKLSLGNLTFGIQGWQRDEGLLGWYTDTFYAGSENGGRWIPEQTFLYLRYHRNFGKIDLTTTSSFRRHTLDNDTREQQLLDYGTGDLGALDLASGIPAFWRSTEYDLQSNQFRNELTVVYNHSPFFTLVSGAEIRNGQIQGNFLRTVEGSLLPGENVAETETSVFDETDLGVFSQATFRPWRRWKFVAGARLDHNDVRQSGGYGTVFNPRLAATWTSGDLVVKAILAEAFKAPSNFNRFATAPGFRDLPNPDLEPERARNLELAVDWLAKSGLGLTASLYRTTYSDAVEPRRVPFEDGTTLQNQSVGGLEILGFQTGLRWTRERWELFANYTYADPRSTDPTDSNGEPRRGPAGNLLEEVRIGDIAEHRVNLGVDARLWRRLRGNLRLNYVGDRDTGADTSVLDNPLDEIDAYLNLNAALTWEDLRPGLDLQMVIHNLTDDLYYHPGVSAADGTVLAARLPQDRRAFFLRLAYGL